MARTGVYRVSALVIYVVMKHSTIFTKIGYVDMRSFHRHSRDTDFLCLLGYSKQERSPVVDLYFYKRFTYSFKSTTNKQASKQFIKSCRNFYSKASKQVVYEKFYKLL